MSIKILKFMKKYKIIENMMRPAIYNQHLHTTLYRAMNYIRMIA